MNKTPLALLFLLTACGYRDREADLVVHNAVIHAIDEMGTVHQAMAIKDGRILELGPEHQIRNRYSTKETFDAGGQHVYPGFIDGHCHFLGYGLNKHCETRRAHFDLTFRFFTRNIKYAFCRRHLHCHLQHQC